MCIGRHLKETVLCGTVTQSVMGKQNIQAKEVFSMDAKKVLAFFSFRSYTDTKGTYHAVLIRRVFVERGFAVIYLFFFNLDPPLKQSSQGEPAGKGVTEAAVWDAWVRRF